MTPEKRLDGYYRRKFGWSLEKVDALAAEQNNVCAICHRPPGKIRLSLDHDHFFDRVKIRVYRDYDDYYWVADAAPFVEPFGGYKSRKEAKQAIKRMLRRQSVRGLLCFRCNSGLQKFEDSKAPLSPAERFDNAAKYLRQFHEKTNRSIPDEFDAVPSSANRGGETSSN